MAKPEKKPETETTPAPTTQPAPANPFEAVAQGFASFVKFVEEQIRALFDALQTADGRRNIEGTARDLVCLAGVVSRDPIVQRMCRDISAHIEATDRAARK